MWLRVLEAWATTRLLDSPTFHRAVRSVYNGVRRTIDGKPMEEMGGTNIDRKGPSFLQHFVDEIKAQIGGKSNKR